MNEDTNEERYACVPIKMNEQEENLASTFIGHFCYRLYQLARQPRKKNEAQEDTNRKYIRDAVGYARSHFTTEEQANKAEWLANLQLYQLQVK